MNDPTSDPEALETLRIMEEFYRYAFKDPIMPQIIPSHPYPCSWWIEPKCVLNSTCLILMACEEGHIRERVLCEGHHNTATDFIDKKLMHCAECEKMLTRHMSKHPIENTWDLEQTLQDTDAIITVFFNDNGTTAPFTPPPPWTIQGPSIPPYTGYPGKYQTTPRRTFPGIKPVPIDHPIKDPTEEDIENLRKALKQLQDYEKTQKQHIDEAYKALTQPTKDPKTLRWINRHFGKNKNP